MTKCNKLMGGLILMAAFTLTAQQTTTVPNYSPGAIVSTTIGGKTTIVTNPPVITGYTTTTVTPVAPAVVLAGVPVTVTPPASDTATNPPPAASPNAAPSIGDDISAVAGWAGNINTSNHFANAILWDGPIYQNQVNVANELGGSYDLWHSVTNSLTTNGVLFGAIETRQRQAGITGSWLSHGGGGEFGYQKCDFRGGVFIDGVYRDHPDAVGATSRLGVEGGFFADKMLSSASAIGLFISGQSGVKYPIFGANLKVTFGNGSGFLGLFSTPKS